MTAPAYGCQLQGEGESHQVSWLITHLNPPGTISLCDDDFAIGIIHLLATDLGADPERLYDTIKRFTDREKARQDKEAARAAADGTGPPDPAATHAAQQEAIAAGALDPDPADYDADGRPVSADLT